MLFPLIYSVISSDRKLIYDEIKAYYTRIRGFVGNGMFNYFLFIVLIILLLMASYPISSPDAFAKHIPLTVQALYDGKWNDNIIENIVYNSESTYFAYSISIIFAALGNLKGFQMFNTLLFICIFFILLQIATSIIDLSKESVFLFGIIYFTTPFFIDINTNYMVDTLPFFFIFVCVSELLFSRQNGVEMPIYTFAFLLGISIFTKLTIIPCVVLLCVGIGYLYIGKSIETKRWNIKKIIIALFNDRKSVFNYCI